MSDNFDIRTDGMPPEMKSLLRDYPRNGWETHPGFKEKTRQWLSAHQMFRQLSATVRKDAESFLDGDVDAQSYADRLGYYGNALVGNPHGHHGWEDHSYFPELSSADPRFDAGLEILEKDHADLDMVLEDFTNVANRTLKLIQLDEAAAREEAGQVHRAAETICGFLTRHLTDEDLKTIANATGLEELVIQGDTITDEGVQRLSRALPSCTIGYYHPGIPSRRHIYNGEFDSP